MIHRILILFASLVTVGFCASAAEAQVNPNRFMRNFLTNRPTVSPYLNLVDRPGVNSSGAATFQTLVRPLVEQRDMAEFQQMEIQQLQRRIDADARSRAQQYQQGGVRPTGHPTRFMNFSHFFPGLNR